MSKLRKSAEGEDCTVRIYGKCNFDPRTTVLCHLRIFGHGGMGLKPPDLVAVYACNNCHDCIDGRDRDDAFEYERDRTLLRALIETHLKMHSKGVIKI